MADDRERMRTRRMIRGTSPTQPGLEDLARMPPPRNEGERERGMGESSGTTGSGESGTATSSTDTGTVVSGTSGSTAGISTDVLIGTLQERVLRVPSQPLRSAESLLSGQTDQTLRARRPPSVVSTKSNKQRRIAEARLELERCEARRARAQVQVADADTRVARAALEAANELDSDASDIDDLGETTQPRISEWIDRSANISTGVDRRRRESRPPPTQDTTTNRDATNVAEALVNALRGLSTRNDNSDYGNHQRPPRYLSDLQLFDGNPAEWIAFSATFKDSRTYFSDVQNLARLRKAITGRARDAVKSLLYTNISPDEIMQALESRFGRPINIIKTEISHLDRLPTMSEDARDLPIIASAVANCVSVIRQLKQDSYLHSHEIVERVIMKMCLHVKFKWYEYRRVCDGEPILWALSRFLTQMSETIQANDTALFKLRDREREKDRRFARTRPKRTFHTAIDTDSDHSDDGNESSDYEEAEAVANTAVQSSKCQCCSRKDHILIKCREFAKLPTPERWTLVRKEKICFRCLKGTHRSFNCRAKACGTNGCEAGHHRLLHPAPQVQSEDKRTEPPKEPSAPIATNTIEVSSVNVTKGERAFLKIIPVHIKGPNATILTNALLDDGSTITLIDQSITDQIGVQGPSEIMRIEGIGGIQEVNSASVKVEIKGVYQKEYETLNAQTMANIKITSQGISDRDLDGCHHLDNIAEQLTYENQRPLILIGQDNWRMLVAREIIEGRPHQPAATRTQLGWVLHGQRKDARRTSIVNHLIRSEQDQLHLLVKEHFKIDSLGIEPKRPQNDPEIKALKMLDEVTERTLSGRYETRLLWRDKDAPMPESRLHAIKRLIGIEKKMDRNPEFSIQYKRQVQNLLDSNYAERTDHKPSSPRTWYLPHFAVVHPQKKKMRLVFDAAARTNGMCLNDALMIGPDLLQSLFGVLIRFRERKVAISADIKEMFLRVGIKEEDRDSLRFLWRDEKGQVAEYRMRSLIFGAASSPCTAIYVKNRNAQEHGEQQPDAVTAIVKNHYMDDYLASYDDDSTTILVSSQVDEIHKKADFELRGWASNSEKVRQHFGAETQSNVELGAPDDYEKTLGLRWQTAKDSLSFTLSLRTSPPEILDGRRAPTKREATSAVMSVFDPLGLAAPILGPECRSANTQQWNDNGLVLTIFGTFRSALSN